MDGDRGRREDSIEENNNNNNNDNNGSGDDQPTVDWRGRPANPSKHGGMPASAFVLGVQGFEIMAIGAVGNNLITYAMKEMHFSLSKSANIVTNFVGTVFILALLGGFLSDSYLGCFWTMLIFAFLELSGFILLSVQAHLPQLKPPKCNMLGVDGDKLLCEEATGMKALIFFVALYLVALGSGCVKPNMIAHGADQFNQTQPKLLARYFNAAYFAFSVGQLIALTLLVWVQTHSGITDVSAAAMAMALICLVSGLLLYRNKPPHGSIFTPIAQVFVAAFLKRKYAFPSDPRMVHGSHSTTSHDVVIIRYSNAFRWLDKACIKSEEGLIKESPWRVCSVRQVNQVKTLISVIPIFACTIVFNTILAQLQTFSVQQASTMNTKLSKTFSIPPASLQAIPYILLIFLVPLYDTFVVPLARRAKGQGNKDGVTPLQRIGLGLFFATFSMVAAAIMENKRRNLSSHRVIMSVFWITPQYVIFGVSEMLTAVGLIEFFYKQPLKGMQAFSTSITYCSYSFGFYLSSVLVSIVNKVTGRSSSHGNGWLSDNDLNKDRLDLFYWLLAAISFLNFLNYLFWSAWYSRVRSSSASVMFHEHEDFNSNNKKSNVGWNDV